MRLLIKIFFFVLFIGYSLLVAKDTLYVFYPSPTRPAVLQQALSEVYKNTSVVVFGRYQDFVDKTLLDKPSLLITKPQVLKVLPGYMPELEGIKNNSPLESYVILSINKGVDPKNLDSLSVGVVDFLGRIGTEAFIAQLVRTSRKPNRASKVEDLLPMLAFNKANALLITESHVAYFKKTSNLNLIETPLSQCKSEIVVIAVRDIRSSKSARLTASQCTKEIFTVLGIDKWR